MIVNILEKDNTHFAVNPRVIGNKMQWDCSNGGYTLIIKTAYGVNVRDYLERISIELDKVEALTCTEYQTIYVDNIGFAIKLFDPFEKARYSGCDMLQEAQSIMILAATKGDNGLSIYEPGNTNQSLNITFNIEITYSKEVVTVKRLLSKEEEIATGFYIVDTDRMDISDYNDGDIYYVVNDRINVPITKEMFKQPIFIKADTFPKFASRKPGINITCREIFGGK